MTLKEFLGYIANKQHVSPSDELQTAACVALLGYGVIKVAKKEDDITFYGLNKNVEVSGEDGKYNFHILPTKENNGKEQMVEVDAHDGKFASSSKPVEEQELGK